MCLFSNNYIDLVPVLKYFSTCSKLMNMKKKNLDKPCLKVHLLSVFQ